MCRVADAFGCFETAFETSAAAAVVVAPTDPTKKV